MKKLLLLITSVLALTVAYAQESDSLARAKEREIKTSGLYLYGEAVGNTKSEATKMAQTALTSEINKEITNNPTWQFAKQIQVKDVEYNTDNIDLMRGNKFRVIAYIPKSNIVAVFSKDAPTIKMTDKKEPSAKEKKAEKAKEQETAPAEVAAVAPAYVAEQKGVLTSTASVQKVVDVAPSTFITKNASDLLQAIVACKNAKEINKILNDNKANGKAVYGKMGTLANSAEAYIVVYKKNGELVAILDKGAGASRKDLISGEMKGSEIYAGNQTIWFQLF